LDQDELGVRRRARAVVLSSETNGARAAVPFEETSGAGYLAGQLITKRGGFVGNVFFSSDAIRRGGPINFVETITFGFFSSRDYLE